MSQTPVTQNESADLEQIRRNFLISIFGLLKGLSLYDVRNSAVQRPLENFQKALADIFSHMTDGKEVTLAYQEQLIFIQGVKTLSHFSILESIKYVQDAMETAMIQSIAFENTMTVDKIGEVFSKWALHLSVHQKPHPIQVSVPGVTITLIDPEKASLRTKSKQLLMSPSYALKHYFILRHHTTEFFKAMANNQIISQRKLRRELIEMAEILRVAPYQLVALSLIRDVPDKIENPGLQMAVSQALATALLSMTLASELQFPIRDQVNLGLIGLLYNVGLLGEEAAAALKNDRLTPVEYKRVIDAQASGVYKLIRVQGSSRPSLERLLSIFEHARGTDVKSVSLTLESRLLKLISQYVALTSDRPFREAYTPAEAAKILASKVTGAHGGELDPILYYVFVRFMGVYPVGSLCLLSDNQKGIIFRPSGEKLGIPLVKLISEDHQRAELVDLSKRPEVKILKTLDPKREGLSIPAFFFD